MSTTASGGDAAKEKKKQTDKEKEKSGHKIEIYAIIQLA